jgi:hypothetical protein
MNKPGKVNLRKAGVSNTNIKRDTDSSVDERKRKIEEILNAQDFVDKWNNEYVGKKGMDDKDLTEYFKSIQLDSGLVIQMFMENPIKHIVKNQDGQVINLDFSIQQIDNRKRNTDTPNWVTTPFPVIDKAVIMAISPVTKLMYIKQYKELKEAGYDTTEFIIPEVGDIIYTNHFMFKDSRYYVDKQAKCEDFVKSQEELRLNNFDFLFKVSNYEIESIIKRDKYNSMFDTKGARITIMDMSSVEEQEEEYTDTDGE